MRTFPSHRGLSGLVSRSALSVLLSGLLSCIGGAQPGVAAGYRYFETPDPFDAWSLKISRWQTSQSDGPAAKGSGSPGSLGARYSRFRASLRVEQARALATWIQKEAREVYADDTGVDHWPTLAEVLASDSDDCDGLELIVHHLLLDLGFPPDEVYRAVVHKPGDGQYHMVTLWFQERDDPWVIDPTGAMVLGMPRMSEVADWVPLKLFSAAEEFTVRQQRRQR